MLRAMYVWEVAVLLDADTVPANLTVVIPDRQLAAPGSGPRLTAVD